MRFLSTLIASTLGALIAIGIVVFFSFVILFAVIATADQTPRVQSGSLLSLELSGTIPEITSGDPLAQAFLDEPAYSLREIVASIDKAAVDDRIRGLWLRVEGLQTSWSSLAEIRDALERFRETGKPIYASSDDHNISEPSYYLASAADSVFAAPHAIFELNGFHITLTFFRRLLENLNVDIQTVRVGTYKSAVEPFIREDLSPENEEQLQAIVDALNREFVRAVSESRGISVDSLNRMTSDGFIIDAGVAHQSGLLDGIHYGDEVVDLWKQRLGIAEDEDLREISLRDYRRTPASDAGLEVNSDGEVAVVYAEGAITSGESGGDNPFETSATLGSETFRDAIREAREAERVKAVVVRINSPGGSVAPSEAIWHSIKETAAEKPVVISMGATAASGGYWMATAGDLIVADPLTITGSIGVFGMFVDASGFFEDKLGVTFDNVKTSPHADLFSGVRPMTDDERARLEWWTDDIYRSFLSRVSESRNLDVAAVDSIAQGRVWAGVDALQIGLVDTLGGLKAAVQIAAERAGLGPGPYQVRVLPRPKPFIERVAESLGGGAVRAWWRLTRSPAERAVLDQTKDLRRILENHGTVQARMMWDVTIQ